MSKSAILFLAAQTLPGLFRARQPACLAPCAVSSPSNHSSCYRGSEVSKTLQQTTVVLIVRMTPLSAKGMLIFLSCNFHSNDAESELLILCLSFGVPLPASLTQLMLITVGPWNIVGFCLAGHSIFTYRVLFLRFGKRILE